jgi:hypothetical protein
LFIILLVKALFTVPFLLIFELILVLILFKLIFVMKLLFHKFNQKLNLVLYPTHHQGFKQIDSKSIYFYHNFIYHLNIYYGLIERDSYL